MIYLLQNFKWFDHKWSFTCFQVDKYCCQVDNCLHWGCKLLNSLLTRCQLLVFKLWIACFQVVSYLFTGCHFTCDISCWLLAFKLWATSFYVENYLSKVVHYLSKRNCKWQVKFIIRCNIIDILLRYYAKT